MSIAALRISADLLQSTQDLVAAIRQGEGEKVWAIQHQRNALVAQLTDLMDAGELSKDIAAEVSNAIQQSQAASRSVVAELKQIQQELLDEKSKQGRAKQMNAAYKANR